MARRKTARDCSELSCRAKGADNGRVVRPAGYTNDGAGAARAPRRRGASVALVCGVLTRTFPDADRLRSGAGGRRSRRVRRNESRGRSTPGRTAETITKTDTARTFPARVTAVQRCGSPNRRAEMSCGGSKRQYVHVGSSCQASKIKIMSFDKPLDRRASRWTRESSALERSQEGEQRRGAVRFERAVAIARGYPAGAAPHILRDGGAAAGTLLQLRLLLDGEAAESAASRDPDISNARSGAS
jgi:hypothetical protein